ncbi:MAG: transcriptional regulator NrdR [bacterium]|jgi:transcriptional repressor NrdR
MRCNQCKFEDTKVIESREAGDAEAIRRRRECLNCSHRFTTYERIEKPQLVVIKNDGTRQLYSREKLLSGLYRACEKTPVTSMQIEQLATNVENKLYAIGEPEISSSAIGQAVMDELANTNEVAYVRFASVYRRFKDIASFEKELSEIRNKK